MAYSRVSLSTESQSSPRTDRSEAVEPSGIPGSNQSSVLATRPTTGDLRQQLIDAYHRVRAFSLEICKPLEPEDFVLQNMTDVSPTRWHLAHTTWFFETFILEAHQPDFKPFEPAYRVLFNSYYNAVGEQFPRPDRGQLSRPTVKQVMAYRAAIDQRLTNFLQATDASTLETISPVLTLGLQHEQQHQELMVTDLKYNLSVNPLFPAYHAEAAPPSANDLATRPSLPAFHWVGFDEGVYSIGFESDGFCFDNELPRHKSYLHSFELANQLVTNRQYLQFIEDGGYEEPKYWLSAGFATAQEHRWQAPIYWHKRDGRWHQYTMAGLQPVDWDEPICHVSLYEADAFARWAGARLPTESEWELASTASGHDGQFADSRRFHPAPCPPTDNGQQRLHQMMGDVWEWTGSQYRPYPGYQADAGALGEYNGKFMCNQFVLRGGSCATSADHIRPTYRNFFPPEARWQFSGIRLARDA